MPVNSSQNSSLEILASQFTILNPDKERLPEVSHEMQLSSLEEREANEKNNIRKTYLSNTKGLMLYKFRRLLRENDLHEVLVCGNGYCFLSCIIIALAEHGIKKTLEVLSTEVMSHIR